MSSITSHLILQKLAIKIHTKCVQEFTAVVNRTHQILTPILITSHLNFYESVVQKYKAGCKLLKMTIVVHSKSYKMLLHTAKIGCDNTYDMRAKIDQSLCIKIYGISL